MDAASVDRGLVAGRLQTTRLFATTTFKGAKGPAKGGRGAMDLARSIQSDSFYKSAMGKSWKKPRP